ncbi:plastocyanin/azurin family copper-binding protein [Deinococcus ruber]|uniref:plastocyanin/azurin family copper-binding protein n=1 Tax=Deinococcus ruber TaxID=1848197 RepID=UPI001669E062|nr:plastocyanin/azurin family copper-binding protein [Deinococcus ruber]
MRSLVASALLLGSAGAASTPTLTFPFKVQGTANAGASGQLIVRTLSPTMSISVLTLRGLTPNTAYVAHYHSLGTASSDPCASNGPISLVFPPFKSDAQGQGLALLRAVPARISGTAGAYVNVHTADDVAVIPLCASVLKAAAPTAVQPTTPQTTTTPPATHAASQQGVTVKIGDNTFMPTPLSVAAGTTVTWVNTGKVTHNVSSVDLPGIRSASLHPGESYSYTFTAPGIFTYYCSYHEGMSATITVTKR